MEQEEIKKLCKERGIMYKGDFIESLTEEEFKNGTAKFNLTAPDGRDVEGIWCYLTPEDREKYDESMLFYAMTLLITMEFYSGDVKLKLLVAEQIDL